MKTTTQEERYTKALFELVGTLKEAKQVPIDVVAFTNSYKVNAGFFDALRDLECIEKNLLADGDQFTRTAKLLTITPIEVLQQEKRAKNKKPGIQFFTPKDEQPATKEVAPEPIKSVPESSKPIPKPIKVTEQTFGEEMAEMDADGTLAKELAKPMPVASDQAIDSPNPFANLFAKQPETAKEVQSECKGDCGHVACTEFGCVDKIADAWKEPAMPTFANDEDAVSYCVDLLTGHYGEDLMVGISIASEVKRQIQVRALDLSDHVAAQAAEWVKEADDYKAKADEAHSKAVALLNKAQEYQAAAKA
ncbi:hypothetical protein [Fibrivirga algicola]|uniref:Uncharacterized protein n=1 Tax=Fibrivirga algicola TaxID=2950420 RepID=A0ABX0QH28_9BACT|nr:hypothetical protein [Fibrivirga algicola]NID09404.1 hypothetical protein [Fibrivirga algicola]